MFSVCHVHRIPALLSVPFLLSGPQISLPKIFVSSECFLEELFYDDMLIHLSIYFFSRVYQYFYHREINKREESKY